MVNGFKNIEQKLHQFTRKYYTSELIKGTILFLSLGCLYFFFTLFLEYFLWLKTTARTLLFWFFLGVELFLLIRFIVLPVFKLIGLRAGITAVHSSKIIGRHFPEVQDKLLNVLQLKQNANKSDLLAASIDQKAHELQSVPFVKAVDFTQNKKFLKYAIIPVLILLVTLFSGNRQVFTSSLERIVNHRTSYIPPAPFSFSLKEKKLQVIQGKSITVFIGVKGKVLPVEAKIHFENQHYYLQNSSNATFSYTFLDVKKTVDFYVEANGVQSQKYQIEVLKTPTINNISLGLNYPSYIGKRNERIQNAGNIVVPEGTKVTWNVFASQTDSVAFTNNGKRVFFEPTSINNFIFSKKINTPIDYQISSSNTNLSNFENLHFSVSVVKDEAPLISVQSNIDSISRGTAVFAGQVSDDYGIKKLQLVYYVDTTPQLQNILDLEITNENIQTFYYEFPGGLSIEKGVNYNLFFQVFDNDGVHGSKKSKSKIFNYRKQTEEELEQELLQEQRNTINNIENSIQKQQQQRKKLEEVQKDLQVKKKINWNDQKKIKKFVKRQNQYHKMMQRQTEKLQENLEEKVSVNEQIQQKKEVLKRRIAELNKLEKQQKLLAEIQKIAEKLNKEDLLKKAKELAQQNQQQERSLTRILELTKRFYVEQKAMQIANKIEKLSQKQERLAQNEANDAIAQKEILKSFEEIKEELKELNKDNENLKEPMGLPDVEKEQEEIDAELKSFEDNLFRDRSAAAKKNQKNSSKKMKEMSVKMQKEMLEMEGESMEENVDDLRKILENLLIFSFKQEQLMNKFDETSTSHPDFGNDLKFQNQLKTYFEHIDDSLYVLSLRLPKISVKIKDDLSTTHYNLALSLDNFSENNFSKGISNQRYVMTAVNDLADYLSNILSDMKNSMSMNKGKGKKEKGSGFSLPDLIKKQGDLSEKMKEGLKKEGKSGEEKDGEKDGKGNKLGKQGKKPGEGGVKAKKGTGESNDNSDADIYEIYKEQSLLRQELQKQISQSEAEGNGTNSAVKRALKKMEDLENEILEKGHNLGTLQKMNALNYELLKLSQAVLEQGKDNKRKSNTNFKVLQKRNIKVIEFKKQFFNQTEILNRQSLPLQQNYKNKVRAYFSDIK
ncbi:MAG: Uncharacterised protein [Polaribacter sejongensis]|nr:MAG: Uncharacterised protein [Polaribacter sejongensis]